MEAEKLRNLGEDELGLEERKTAEALFRLRFQMKLGQTEGVKKLRELRKDIARIHTVRRERELGIHAAPAGKSGGETETKAEAAPAKSVRRKVARPVKKKAAAKKTARKKTTRSGSARRPAAKASGSKKKAARSTSVKKG